MYQIATSSPTADLLLDMKTGNPIDLSLEDFEDEDLSDILHENGLQLSSYSNNNFKTSGRNHQHQRQKNGKSKTHGHIKNRDKHLYRASSESAASCDSKGKTCNRPRPTSLRLFVKPARPGPLPSSCLINQSKQRIPDDVTATELNPSKDESADAHQLRMKSTYSDETLKNNNTAVENQTDISIKISVQKSQQRESNHQVQAPLELNKNASCKDQDRHSKCLPSDLTVTRQMSLAEDYMAARSMSEPFGLTRSASEWSMFDPDKSDYCFINGEFKEQTHSAQFKFVPRHEDEILLEVNDPIHVLNEADDFWYEGINMRTGKKGIFPCYYAQSLLDVYDKMSDLSIKSEPVEQFDLYFIGSVEVPSYKGIDMLCQAMNKVAQARKMTIRTLPPIFISLLVSSTGIKLMDHSLIGSRRDFENDVHCFSSSATLRRYVHFFHIQNVSFCGHHPKNDKYFAFISRHPRKSLRYACHVFVSERSTRPLAESIGRAFTSFFHDYINSAHAVEDLYID